MLMIVDRTIIAPAATFAAVASRKLPAATAPIAMVAFKFAAVNAATIAIPALRTAFKADVLATQINSAAEWALVAIVAVRMLVRKADKALVIACHLATRKLFAAAAASALLIRIILALARFAAELTIPRAAQNCSVLTKVGIAKFR